MKHLFLVKLFLAVVFMHCFLGAKATHIVGGNITCTYLGNDSFLVTSEIFRDCNGILLSGINLAVATDGGSSVSMSSPVVSTGKDITPIGKNTKSRCSNISSSFQFGFQQYFVTARFRASTSVCNYIISQSECCMSGAITTGASSTNFYLQSTINICEAGYHDLPVFEEHPILFACVSTCTSLFQNVTSDIRDSLVYTLTTPLSASGTPTTYSGSYSATEPIDYTGAFGHPDLAWDTKNCKGFHYNTVTGEVNFRAVKQDESIICYQVDQWRKNSSGVYKKIGTVVRESIINAIDCGTNASPVLTGIDSTTADSFSACIGTSVSFRIFSSDPDTKDTLSLAWNNSIPGATFKVSTTPRPVGTFSWTPTAKDIRSTPYSFIATVVDGHDPVPSKFQKKFTIFVRDSFPAVSFIKTEKGCNIYTLATKADSNYHLKYNWTVNGTSGISKKQTLNYAFKKQGNNYIDLQITTSGGCTKHIRDTLKLDTVWNVKKFRTLSNNATICYGDSVKLSASGANKYLWKPATGLSSVKTASTFASPKTTTTYLAYMTDTTIGCTLTDTVKVTVDTTCVWPGDANRDKKVDYADILTLGLATGSSGTARAKTSNSWAPYLSTDWKSVTLSGINFKNMDCNGDGKVDVNDTLAISLNYGKSHLKSEPQAQGKSTDPPLYFKFAKDTFYAGDTVSGFVYAGSGTKPLSQAYGIGFRSNYNALPMVSGSGNMKPVCDFLCDAKNINFRRADISNQTTDFAVVRTNGIDASGTGKIAEFQYLLKDSLQYSYDAKGTKIFAALLGTKVIDKHGNDIAINPVGDSAIVMKKHSKKTGIDLFIPETVLIKIYPNPASHEIIIESFGAEISQIIILNEVGKQLKLIERPSSSQIKVDISELPAGMYFIFVKTLNGTYPQKMLIQR